MKNKDIEKFFSKSKELTPRAEIKEKVISTQTEIVREVPQGEVIAKKSFFSLKALVSLFLALIIMLSGVFLGLTYTGYTNVYIDVNPSIELSVNRWSKIVDVEYLNEDAERVFSNADIMGKKLESGVETILDALNENGYLEGAELSIGTYCKNQKRSQKMLNKCEKTANEFKQKKNCNMNVNCSKISKEEKEAGKGHGLSPTKYNLIQQIIAKDSSYTMEMLRDKTVKELKEILGVKCNKK